MKLLLSLLLLIPSIVLAEVQVFLPGIQMRFQDTLHQARESVYYKNYAIHYQMQSYILGLEYNKSSEDSGNSSLKVESQTDEWLMVAGYSFYTWIIDRSIAHAIDNKKNVSIKETPRFEFFLHGVLGKTQTQVKTSVVNTSSTQKTDWDDVVGVGAAVQFKIGYFLTSLDTHYLQSKGFSPNFVPVTTLKIGAEF